MYNLGLIVGFMIAAFGSYLLITIIKFSGMTWIGKKNLLLSITIILIGISILAGIWGYKIATFIYHIP